MTDKGAYYVRVRANHPEYKLAVGLQTGHALWALPAARVPKSNPQVAKAIAYPLAAAAAVHENLRTPFRERQMAVLALSAALR